MIRAKILSTATKISLKSGSKKMKNKDSGQNYNEAVSASIILARTGFRPDRVTQLTQKFQWKPVRLVIFKRYGLD